MLSYRQFHGFESSTCFWGHGPKSDILFRFLKQDAEKLRRAVPEHPLSALRSVSPVQMGLALKLPVRNLMWKVLLTHIKVK
ncbi:hypothetical protein V22_31440 [Calycomorphotria hydatis]|uniref:Uncharacterized protein n=1 Tax=Calycomorphotria hydatis TaxID=2528027 RepID=A0A517TBX9_9PLAN|nr:hypothetical protein V22_31440 [Calycomorphotria hydatis]